MRVLYMFGNGFDIAHGIQTTYENFRQYLSENNELFLTRFEEMYDIYPIDHSEPWYTEEDQKKWEDRAIKSLWKTFEEDIGRPNVDAMYEQALSLVDSMPSIGIKDTLDEYWRKKFGFSKKLHSYVLEWLNTIDTSVACKRKDALIGNKKDVFINFNYTDTLESIYYIPNVFHIHGGVSSCTSTPPIMGHGNKYLVSSYRKKAKQYREEYNEWAESICNAIADYVESLLKDSDNIISRNHCFFSSLGDVEEVVCLGISFGDVDIPYLNRIKDEVSSSTRWIIYYHDEESKQRLKNVFGITGIVNHFKVFFLESENFWDS